MAASSVPAGNGATYRFADYQVNFQTFELRKRGLRIKLQEKPLRILQALLERPGELVTREELQQRLWAKDLYVDFERNLTSATNKLRAALNDSAESPRYIETLPRRGYRFIAPVEVISAEEGSAVGRQESLPPVIAIPQVAQNQVSGEPIQVPAKFDWNPRMVGMSLAVVLVAAVLLWGFRQTRRSSAKAGPEISGPVRLVVLPFVNLTGDEKQDILCDGLTEEMIAELSRLKPGKLDVIARTSAMHYKGTGKPVTEIGRELNVGYVLESSVREFGDRVRVTSQLVRASDAGHVWTGEYDREMQDVLLLQQEIATAVATEIKLSLAPQGALARRNALEVNPEAYRNYLLGRYYWNKRTPAGIVKSVQYYHEALREDPNFALAYAGLADSLLFDGDPEIIAEAKTAARKAIELDPTLGEPHATLGFIALMRDWDFALSKREFQQALQLDSNYATAHHWYAFYFEKTGHLQEAVRELRRAADLDPLSPIIRIALASGLSGSGRLDEALTEIHRVLEMNPDFAKGHLMLAGIYEQKRMYPEAIAEFKKARDLGLHVEATADLACVYAKAGDRAQAEKTIRDIERRARRANVPPPAGDLALIYLALGNRDQTMKWLEKGFEQRDEALLEIKYSLAFEPLRSDPRFQGLVRRMNFPS